MNSTIVLCYDLGAAQPRSPKTNYDRRKKNRAENSRLQAAGGLVFAVRFPDRPSGADESEYPISLGSLL